MATLTFVTLLSIFVLSCAADDKCMYIGYREGSSRKDDSTCMDSKICKKNFTISHIDLPPYSTAGLFETILKRCCGRCRNLTNVKTFMNITEVSASSINSSDFIAPFLGKSSAVALYGHHFIPLIDVPNAYYFTKKHRSILADLIIDCLKLYPLIILCLLTSIISGFIVWSVETWYAPESFPRSFAAGLFEGFWYSFVSMTTVGYGDLTVRSIPARMFSVIWILIGICMFGLLTASFTTKLTTAMEPIDHSMSGSKVGALQFRDYDQSLIVNHGGIVKQTSAWNFYSDVLMLVRMLRNEEIHGFVLDKYTLAYTMQYFDWKKNNVDFHVVKNKSRGETYDERKDDIDFFNFHTYRSFKSYDREKLSYGILVKNFEDYRYFGDAIADNRITLETSIGSEMNEQFPRAKKNDLFSSTSVYYVDTVKVVMGALGFVLFSGIFTEIYGWKRKMIANTETETVLQAELIIDL